MRPFKRHLIFYLVSAFLICSITIFHFVTTATAASSSLSLDASPPDQAGPAISESTPIVSNEVCLGCHGQPALTMKLLNGDILDLYVDPAVYSDSIHGKDGYACVQCHTNLGDYPHPLFTATDLRDATIRLTGVCDRCHSGEYNLTLDSIHYAKQAIGNKQAAVCSDCHGSHSVRQWTDPKTHAVLPDARLNIPATCSKCHFDIYQKYRNSVHGSALTQDSNLDVPTCIDCHGVHNIPNPTTAEFRLKSPQLCAGCHTNPALMDKYGISTNVLNTYVADFHGTTVTLFEKQSPDAQTNKPVCYDCHGVHDISRVDDPKTGLDMQQNLLVRCRQCHPDATSNFPTAWMSHYIPSPSHYSLVYYVNLFYKFFIPLVLGSMVILVMMDAGHSMVVKTTRGKSPRKQPPAKAQSSQAPESSSPLPSAGRPSVEPTPPEPDAGEKPDDASGSPSGEVTHE